MDPTSGIAAVCCTQIVPILDSEVLKVWKEAEEALYEGLGYISPYVYADNFTIDR